MSLDQYYQRYGSAFGPSVTPELLSNIGMLESSHNPTAVNDWDSNFRAGIPSKGVMQYIQPTFDADYAAAAAARPEMFASMGQKDWMNPEQQIASAAYAISRGKGGQWATFDKASKGNVPKGKTSSGTGAPSKGVGYGKFKPSPNPVIPSGLTPMQGRAAIAFASDPTLQAGYVEKHAPPPPSVGAGTSSTDGVPGSVKAAFPQKEGEPVWSWLQRLGQEQFGLRNDPGIGQLYGGKHSPGSAHYSGQAIDFGDALNTVDQLNRANEYYQSIGAKTIWQAPGHYNHLHVEYQ